METHAHLFTAHVILRPVDGATEDRIRAEYRELPGLCLTTEQAMRLWSLDRPTCEAALERLIRNGVLDFDGCGRYARGRVTRCNKPRRRKARSMEASPTQK